jgi:hypothetical protein
MLKPKLISPRQKFAVFDETNSILTGPSFQAFVETPNRHAPSVHGI